MHLKECSLYYATIFQGNVIISGKIFQETWLCCQGRYLIKIYLDSISFLILVKNQV